MVVGRIETVQIVGPSGGTYPQSQDVTVASGPGATPKGALVITGIAAASGTVSATTKARLCVGMIDSDLVQRSAHFFADDNAAAASGATRYRIDNSTVILHSASTTTLDVEANVTTLQTDGFQLSWSAGSNARGQACFFFGDDTRTAVRNLTGSASIGGTASISGLSFAPDFIYVASVNQAVTTDGEGAEGMMSFGFAARTSSTQSCTVLCAENLQDPTSSGCLTRGDRVAIQLTSAAGTISEGASLEVTSWNSDGVTLTTRGSAAALPTIVLCVKLPNTSAWAGAPTLPASAAGSFSRTDPQFKPMALFTSACINATAGTVVSTRGSMSVGVNTANAGGHVSVLARDAQTTTDAHTVESITNNLSLMLVGSPVSYDWLMDFTSFDALGWTGSVTDTAAADRPTAYMAVSVLHVIDQTETEAISDAVVFMTSAVIVTTETEAITDEAVLVGVATIVANETEEITDQAILAALATIVCDETEVISDDCVLVPSSPFFVTLVCDETEEITDSVRMAAGATIVADETETITETAFLYLGAVLVSNDTEEITDSFARALAQLKRGFRGTWLQGGAEAATVLSAGAERGRVRSQ